MSQGEKHDDLQGKNIILLGNNPGDASHANKGENNLNANDLEKNSMSKALEFDTLDESISETLSMLHKLEYVLVPRTHANENKKLRNCIIYLILGDLWGPLLLCITLSIVLTFGGKSGKDDEKGLIFVVVFVIVWLGGLIVTLNSQFLGANM